jgi:hypothetical protein
MINQPRESYTPSELLDAIKDIRSEFVNPEFWQQPSLLRLAVLSELEFQLVRVDAPSHVRENLRHEVDRLSVDYHKAQFFLELQANSPTIVH